MINVPFSEETAHTVFSFIGTVPEQLLTASMPPTVRLREEALQTLSARLHMIDGMEVSPTRGAHIRALITEVLLSFLPPITCKQHIHTLPVWMQQLLSALENADLNGQLDLAMFSDVGISYEHICRSFHRYLGVTPSEHINSIRLRRAAQRLRTEPYTEILNIALECGFGNLSYFYRCFKKMYGVPPGKYRQEHIDTTKQ